MARPGRLFLPLDMSYFDDGRVCELSDGAQLLDLRAMLLVRRLQTDGRLTRTQFARIAPESGGDIGAMIGELVKVSLWEEDGDGLRRHAWASWNDSADDIAAMAQGGTWGNHLRWHTKRGVVKDNCPHCLSGDHRGPIGGRLAPESPPESKTRPEKSRVDTNNRTSEDGDPVDEISAKASRVVVVIAQRIATRAERAGKVSTTVDAYANGIDKKIRSKAFPEARRLLIEDAALSVDQVADRIMTTLGEDGAEVARATSNGAVRTEAQALASRIAGHRAAGEYKEADALELEAAAL
jgi:phosphoribosyl-ATP pyrophosphohydrolase